MDAGRLHDLICRGMGRTAHAMGDYYDLFRPSVPDHPLDHANLVMRLPVLLDDPAVSENKRGADQEIRATFDSISTHPGDYLSGPKGILFVAAVPDRERPLCVLTNASVDVFRARGPDAAGLNPYGGVTDETLYTVLRDWPVRLSFNSSSGPGELPADRSRSVVRIRFPRLPVEVRAADIIRDDQARRYVVVTAAPLLTGWIILARGQEV